MAQIFVDDDSDLELKDIIYENFNGAENDYDKPEYNIFDPKKFTFVSHNQIISKLSSSIDENNISSLPINQINSHIFKLSHDGYYIKNLYVNIDKHLIEKVEIILNNLIIDQINYNFYDFFKCEYYHNNSEFTNSYTHLIPLPLLATMGIKPPKDQEITIKITLKNENKLDLYKNYNKIFTLYYEKYSYQDDINMIHFITRFDNAKYGGIISQSTNKDIKLNEYHIMKKFIIKYNNLKHIDDFLELLLIDREDRQFKYIILLNQVIVTNTNEYIAIYNFKTNLNMSNVHSSKILNKLDNMIEYMTIRKLVMISDENGNIGPKFAY